MKKRSCFVLLTVGLLMLLIAPLSAQAACGYYWTTENPHKAHYCTNDDQNPHQIKYFHYGSGTDHKVIIVHQDGSATKNEMLRIEPHMEVMDSGFPATCLVSGLTDGSHCPLCNHVTKRQDVISPTGHTRVIDPAVPATCTTPGKTVGAHCSTCGAIILAQEEIPAAGNHTEVVDEPYKAATCKEAGHEKKSHCSVCDAILSDGKEIPKLTSHTEVIDEPYKAATCKEAGHEKKSHCSVCDAVLSDGKEIPKLTSHTEVIDEPYKAATCKEAGHEKKSHCSVCDAVLSDGKEIPKLTSHTEVIDEPYKAPTCKEAGHEKKSHCSVCDAVLPDGKEIPKIAHTLVKDAAVAATCTTGSQTEGSHCSACGQVITAQQPTAPAGHNYNEVTVAPTATKDGYILKTCTVCGATEKTVLPATGCKNHYYRTWTANRNHHWAKCVRCGETESLACEYLDFSVSGVQQHICPICGAFANTPFTLVQAKAQGSTLPHGNLVVRQQLVPFGEEAVTLPGVDQPVKVLWAFTTCYEYSGRMQRWNTPVQLTLPANATGTMLIQIDASGNVSPVIFTMVDGNLMVSCPAASIFLMVE